MTARPQPEPTVDQLLEDMEEERGAIAHALATGNRLAADYHRARLRALQEQAHRWSERL